MMTAVKKASEKISRKWIEEIVYSLLREGEVTYGLFLHKILIETTTKLIVHHSDGRPPAPACIGMKRDGTLIMTFSWPFIEKLTFEQRRELLKHEVLHVVFGHISSRGFRITDTYGPVISNIGMDLVINQHIDPLMFADDCPIKGLLPSDFGFPNELTTVEYCELLIEKFGIEATDRAIDKVLKMIGDGMLGVESEDGDLPPGQTRILEVMDLSPEEKEILDASVKKVLNEVREQADRVKDKKEGTGRGWDAAEAREFIKQLNRKAQAPWHRLLRAKESFHRTTLRMPTKIRPSRRHPQHYGRIRKCGLSVWFMIDTSGSMGEAQLSMVDAELRGIDGRGAEITVIHSDAGIANVEPYSRHRSIKEFYGRGGTDFSEVLIALRKEPRKPAIFVGYTDGYGGIEQYIQEVKDEIGEAAYDAFVAKCRSKSIEGVDTLWLIPEGCMDPEDFKESVCSWGDIIVIPNPKGTSEEDDEALD
jgi:predicted metal-dependent peptidase